MLALVAACCAALVPAGHDVHQLVPVLSLYSPGAQGEQLAFTVWLLPVDVTLLAYPGSHAHANSESPRHPCETAPENSIRSSKTLANRLSRTIFPPNGYVDLAEFSLHIYTRRNAPPAFPMGSAGAPSKNRSEECTSPHTRDRVLLQMHPQRLVRSRGAAESSAYLADQQKNAHRWAYPGISVQTPRVSQQLVVSSGHRAKSAPVHAQ